MKKSKKLKIFIVLLLIVIIIVAILCGSKLLTDKEQNEVKILKEIKSHGYKLDENETEVYKSEFDELENILTQDEINYETYAKQVAKLFVIDFYTLDNKLSKNDIGGIEFIKESMRDNFIEEARSTFYKYLEVKTENRTQNLPIVSEITDVFVENTKFTYTDKTVDENAYKVTISWNYEQDLGYETEANMIIVREDKKLYIVEMN